jgi:hypothetical protein
VAAVVATSAAAVVAGAACSLRTCTRHESRSWRNAARTWGSARRKCTAVVSRRAREEPPVARAALVPDIVAATAPGSGPPPSPPASVIGEIESAREREFLNRLTRCQYSDTHARRWSCRPPPVRASASAVLPVSPLHARRGTREEGRERGFEPSAQARLLIRLFHRNANVCRNVPADSDKCRGMRRMRRQHRREENLC